ncbi:MAG: YihY/virulence factor BrkB family protein [Anaerolineales bacterium]
MANNKTHKKKFLSELYNIWIAEQPFHHAPGLAYYAIFSFVPVIYIAISMAGIFFDEVSAQNELIFRVTETLGEEAATLLQESLLRLNESLQGGSQVFSVIALIALILTASLMFFQLQYVLNTIWKVPPPRRDGTRVFFQGRILAFLMVLGVGALFIIVVIAQFILSWLGARIPLNISIPFGSALFFLLLGTLSFALVFKVLPNADITWRDVWVGAFVTAVLFVIGVNLILAYLGNGNFTSPQEAAGAVLVLLLAFYFLSTILIFGAVFTRVFASMYGSKIVPQSDEVSVEDQGQGVV